MESNYIWVIEIKIRISENWCPIAGQTASGINGVHYTRAEAREAKRGIEAAKYYKSGVQYRIKKYKAVD